MSENQEYRWGPFAESYEIVNRVGIQTIPKLPLRVRIRRAWRVLLGRQRTISTDEILKLQMSPMRARRNQ